jgi:SAM-dependent methyltransferase
VSESRRPLGQALAERARSLTARWGFTRRARRGLRDWIARSGPPHYTATREDLSFRYLRGDGIEIGALCAPLRVPSSAHVRYVDHAGYDELRALYPEHDWIVVPDVIDDGERLGKFGDESLDFVIANHMLEHVEDPIEALRHFLRVLRPGGVLFLTLPDSRRTFDGRRARTTVEHLLRDHREGPEVSRHEHYEEWARIVDCVPEDQVRAAVERFAAESARHHFHVWELETFLALLVALEVPADVEAAQVTQEEFAVVLRKNPGKEWPDRRGQAAGGLQAEAPGGVAAT